MSSENLLNEASVPNSSTGNEAARLIFCARMKQLASESFAPAQCSFTATMQSCRKIVESVTSESTVTQVRDLSKKAFY